MWKNFLELVPLRGEKISSHACKTGGTYHLHGKTGNSSWKINWFAPFRLGSLRKFGIWFVVMLFFCSFKSLQLTWIDFFGIPSPATSHLSV